MRIDVRKGEAIKDGADVIGNVTKCKVVKNKVAPPFKECSFDLLYGEGTSYEGEIIDIGSALGLIVKSGSWYSYKGERIGQGKERTRQFLKEHPEICQEIEGIIRKNMDQLTFTASKGSKASTVELKKDAKVTLDGGEVLSAPEHMDVSQGESLEESLSSVLTDVDLDVEADLEDFE